KCPANAPGERGWFIAYGVASFIYRLFLISFIVFLLADKYFIVGIILAIWAVITMAVLPIYKQIKFLMTNKQLKGKRSRAISLSMAFVGLLVALTFLPVPLVTMVEGIVWANQESRIRMDSQGFVDQVHVQNGERVTKGQILLVCKNNEIETNLKRLTALLDELKAQYTAVSARSRSKQDRIQAELVREQINAANAQIEKVNQQRENLIIKSPIQGTYVAFTNQSLLGRFLQRGEVLGFVTRNNAATVRVLVPQDRINLVRQHTENITVRTADKPSEVLAADISREVPLASQDLPSAALSFEGGGAIPTNPNQAASEAGQLSAFQSWFQIDITIDRPEDEIGLGERVYARFSHGNERLGKQLYRVIRQTFLSKFNV
ncbi:MAG: efflux RND transporter periplasmic adaptor subunit, partial [Arenicellales bacterium]